MSNNTQDPGPPDGKERRSRNRMPDTDWLTGLSSRAAFARQVGQADQDRDQFAVAIIGIGHIDEINRHLGFAIGDDLLRVVGRALADRVGVGTTVARLGGAQFGLMTVGPASEDVGRWIEPVVSAIESAIAGWTFEQIDFNGSYPIEPQLMIGAAGGYSGRVWADAAIALDVCETDRVTSGARLAVHDPDDRRFLTIRTRHETNDAVRTALDDNTMRYRFQPIEPEFGPVGHHRWFRIVAVLADQADRPVDPADLQPAIGLRLEHHLVAAAAELIGSSDGPTHVTVPVRWSVGSGRGRDYWLAPALNRHGIPADLLRFECPEPVIGDGGGPAVAALADLVEQGSDIVLSECSGGAQTVAVLDTITAKYLRPPLDLVRRAGRGDRRAVRVLDGLTDLAADGGGALIIPERYVPAPIDQADRIEQNRGRDQNPDQNRDRIWFRERQAEQIPIGRLQPSSG